MSAAQTSYFIEVIWESADLPRWIGPFDSPSEARDWAQLNTSHSDAYEINPLGYPWMRSGGETAESRLDRLERALEAWIRHGEAVPADVTTYDREIVNREIRELIAEATS